MPCFHDMSLNAGGDGNREEAAGFGLMVVNGELGTGCPLGMLAQKPHWHGRLEWR